MTIEAQTAPRVGDFWVERTPSGRELALVVEAVDVEPKYRHDDQSRFIRFRREDGYRFDVSERGLTKMWTWFYPAQDSA